MAATSTSVSLWASILQASNGEQNKSTRPSSPRRSYRPGWPSPCQGNPASQPPFPFPQAGFWGLYSPLGRDIHQHHFWSHLQRASPPPPQAANPDKAQRRARQTQPRAAHSSTRRAGGAEAGLGAAVILSVRSSNWIPNTQRSAETPGRGESKGRGIQQIKGGILPRPQRLRHAGWEGTLVEGCPSRGKGPGSPSRQQRRQDLLSSSLVLPSLCSHGALGLHATLPPVGSGHPPRPGFLLLPAPGSVLEMRGKAQESAGPMS